MAKPMMYKEEDGTRYKISFSEELQLKNLRAQKKIERLLKASFYAKMLLIIVFTLWFLTFLYVLYRLDAVNFFTTVMWNM